MKSQTILTNRLKLIRRIMVATLFVASVVAGATADTGLLTLAQAQSTAKPWSKMGREATADEVRAWDIDVRADFKGLPAGQGSVDEGIEIWEVKCASCHGTFGESNEVFTPLTGGTTVEDIRTGRVKKLTSDYPHRTTLMKLAHVSTLWDYINRAMPWNAPKSLKTNEVYAVTAYLLSLGEIVSDDFVLSDKNIATVQERLPNRNGLKKFEGMWKVDGKPDVQGDACMTDCKTTQQIQSFIPDFARNSHGNLATQHRIVGPTRGADTTQPAPTSMADAQQRRTTTNRRVADDARASEATSSGQEIPSALALATQHNCLACHAVDKKVLGPAFDAVAKKYADQTDAIELLSQRVRSGASGTWGSVPMPANPNVSEADAKSIVTWILSLHKK